MKPIYLDYNATTPIATEAADEMKTFLFEHFGNPMSGHIYSEEPKKAILHARKQVADFLNCDPSEVVFTSGGTESNNHAIKGIALAPGENRKHIIISAIEHLAVSEVCRYLENLGFETTIIDVDEFGIVKLNDIKNAIQKDTLLISIMHANNEVGSVQPIAEISRLAKKHGIFVHSDAAQSAGKIKIDVDEMGVDLLSIASHKLYGPKGVGVLYIRNGTKLEKLLHGANHEHNQRAGTVNVIEIIGLGKACELAHENLDEYSGHYRKMRDYLHQLLEESLPQIRLNGHPEKRLPNTLSISFPNIEANKLIAECSGVAVSSGAACHSGCVSISAVLKAMNVPIEYAMGTIRFSTGRSTSEKNIEDAAKEIIAFVKSYTT